MFVETDYDGLAASCGDRRKGIRKKKKSRERAVGRAKVKLDGHKYLG